MKNESVKKSLEKSKNVLEEKRNMVKRKICIKTDQHVYNNSYELRSRAINKSMTEYNYLHLFRVPPSMLCCGAHGKDANNYIQSSIY